MYPAFAPNVNDYLRMGTAIILLKSGAHPIAAGPSRTTSANWMVLAAVFTLIALVIVITAYLHGD
jgi:hypothetical protein